MRKSRKIRIAQQKLRKNGYICLAFAICTLCIFYFVDAFDTMNFSATMPILMLIIGIFFLFKNIETINISNNKSFLITGLNIILTLIFFNLYLFENYSNFKTINALSSLQLSATNTIAEGKIQVNQYQIGSGKRSRTYTDLEFLNPQGKLQLKIKCDFFDKKNACPQLIKFDQQLAKIIYYAEYPHFSLNEALLLDLQTKTTSWSHVELLKHYLKQKYTTYFYFFIISIANILTIRLILLDTKYNFLKPLK